MDTFKNSVRILTWHSMIAQMALSRHTSRESSIAMGATAEKALSPVATHFAFPKGTSGEGLPVTSCKNGQWQWQKTVLCSLLSVLGLHGECATAYDLVWKFPKLFANRSL